MYVFFCGAERVHNPQNNKCTQSNFRCNVLLKALLTCADWEQLAQKIETMSVKLAHFYSSHENTEQGEDVHKHCTT